MKDSVIVLSGGMDSVTMLYEYQDRIAFALSFDYGSNHNARELAFAHLQGSYIQSPCLNRRDSTCYRSHISIREAIALSREYSGAFPQT